MIISSQINGLLKKIGIQINRYPDSDSKRLIKLINHFGINKIFDVGANIGGYSLFMKELGFKGEIVSFEPSSNAFKKLKLNSKADKKWILENFALGNEEGEIMMNISENSVSSSILDMLPAHVESAPFSKYISKEKIKICKLDSIFNNYYKEGDRIFLKIDAQGFEKNVLEGAEKSLIKINGIQLEMSLVSLYKGDTLFEEMIAYLKLRGFKIYSLEPGFSHPTSGQLLQMDGIFYR